MRLAVPLLLGLSACYQVEQPTQWTCSNAEPRCPPGQVCNGSRCVMPTEAGMPDGPARPDTRITSPDAATPAPDHGPPACTSLAEWTCTWMDYDWVELSCGNRFVDCYDDYGWYCECYIGQARQNDADCGDDPYAQDGCNAAWSNLGWGCCTP